MTCSSSRERLGRLFGRDFGLRPESHPLGVAHLGNLGTHLGSPFWSRSTHSPSMSYRYRPSPKQLRALLKLCASAPVREFSRSAHSSPAPEFDPTQKMVTSHVTRIYAAGGGPLRCTVALVCTAYFRVQPAGVNKLFSRSLYARGSAYGIISPRWLSSPHSVIRHCTRLLSNGTSKARRTSSSSSLASWETG